MIEWKVYVLPLLATVASFGEEADVSAGRLPFEKKQEAAITTARRDFDDALRNAKGEFVLRAREAIAAAEGAGDEERKARLVAELDAFLERGELPISLPSSVRAFERDRRTALAGVEGSWRQTIDGYRSLGFASQADAAEKSLSRFLSENEALLWNDLLCAPGLEPWTPTATGEDGVRAGDADRNDVELTELDQPCWTRSGRTFVSTRRGRCSLLLPLPVDALDYDLELALQRTEGDGVVDLWIPTRSDYRRLSLAGRLFPKNGTTRLLLAMTGDALTLHVDGSKQESKLEADSTGPLAEAPLHARIGVVSPEESSFALKSARLRWRSVASPWMVVRGDAPRRNSQSESDAGDQERSAKPHPPTEPKVEPKEDLNARYISGLVWRDTFDDGKPCKLKLKKRDGTHVSFEVDGTNTGKTWIVSGDLVEGRLIIDSVVRGKGEWAATRHPNGYVKINDDGTLSIHCTFRADFAKLKNRDCELKHFNAKRG